jgi:inorganic pyrophosphatase
MQASKVKYELDKDTGMLYVDRVLASSVRCAHPPQVSVTLKSDWQSTSHAGH